MTLVIDASVAIKWFLQEEGSDRAAALIDHPEPIIAPDLILAEVCNAAWKAVRRGQLLPAEQDDAIRTLLTVMDLLFPLAPLAARAVQISRALDHPAYDCFYLALCEEQRATMVTFDTRLLGRVAGTEWAHVVEAC